MTLHVLPTLYPARTIDIDGHHLDVSIVIRERDFALKVSGPIRVGRFNYTLSHLERLDPESRLLIRDSTYLTPSLAGDAGPRASTIARHETALHQTIVAKATLVRQDPEWIAAAECLAAYDRTMAWISHLGRQFSHGRRAAPLPRAGCVHESVTAARDLLMAQAGTLYPGPALPILMQLIKDNPRITLDELGCVAFSICPALKEPNDDWTYRTVASGALVGDVRCLERLGWSVVEPA